MRGAAWPAPGRVLCLTRQRETLGRRSGDAWETLGRQTASMLCERLLWTAVARVLCA